MNKELEAYINSIETEAKDYKMNRGSINPHQANGHRLTLIKIIRELAESNDFYGDPDSWDHEKFLCMSRAGRDDTEEHDSSRFLPGKKARAAEKAILEIIKEKQ